MHCSLLWVCVLQASSLLQLFLRPSPISFGRQQQQQQQGRGSHSTGDGQLPAWAEEGGGAGEGGEGWGGDEYGYSDDGDAFGSGTGAEGYNAGEWVWCTWLVVVAGSGCAHSAVMTQVA